jgi:hypothetical protein
MEQLVALVQEIEDRWRHTDVVSYARLTRKACGTLASLNLADSRQHSLAQNLAQDFAMRALHKADDMPLDVECNFLYGVRQDGFVNGKPFEGEARAQLRRRQTALWLHAWQRIDATIDKNWDPDDTGVSRVPPPWSTGLPAGVAPSAIKDPQLRAQYEAAIEANCQKNARYSLQYRARLLKKSWIPNAERFIFRIYTEPPARPAELEALLNEYIADADKRRRILHAVETKKLPDDLIRTRKRPRSAK